MKSPTLPICLLCVLSAACFFSPSTFAQQAAPSPHADAIVAADGSGQYTTVTDAINKTPQTASAANPWTILVKSGTYKELVYVQREKHFVHLIGEGPDKTKITFNLAGPEKGIDGLPMGTYRTPTMDIDADDFTMENLTVENSAGPVGQALAIRIDGDRVTIRNCNFLGFQDTIFINRGRQYFENCGITGAVDFIFGGATAFFEKCHITTTRDGYLTAASTPQDSPYGYVFDHCDVTAIPPAAKVYLGRPWRQYSSVTFMNTSLPDAILPIGWNNWGSKEREKTVRYSEYHNTGPGAKSDGRAPWSHQLTDAEAANLTPPNVLGGWDPTAPK